MSTLCRDVSNYTVSLTAEMIQQWKSEGVGLVIIQAFPQTYHQYAEQRDQIRVCASQGMLWDAYCYDYLGSPSWLDGCLHGLTRVHDEEGLLPRMIFLDEEDVESEQGWSPLQRTTAINQSMLRADRWSVTYGLQVCGIYTAAWWWRPRTANSGMCAGRKLWWAEYDGIPDATVFTPFGSWDASMARVKQYAGTQPDGTDLNVLSDAEEAELGPTPDPVPIPEPPPTECQPYKDAIARAVNRLQIEDQRKTAAGKPAALRRTVHREIASELYAVLG